MDTIIKEYGGILTAILCTTVGFSIFALCIIFFGGNSKQMVSEMTGVQSATYAEGGETGDDNPISPTNCKHDYGTWAIEKQPTCTEQGIRFRICKDCGNKETGVVAKTKHDYSEEYTIDVKPICIKAGSKSQHCSICGAKRNITTIEKLGEAGHNLEWAIDKSPTCIEEGLKSQYCSYCNARRNKTVIPIDLINGHKYGDFVIDTKPTCITTGVKSKYCSLCNNRTEITDIPNSGHKYGDFVIDRQPTCVTTGIKSKYCSVCNDRTEITSIPNSGHVSTISNYTCGTCGGSFSYNAYARHTRIVRNSCSTLGDKYTYACGGVYVYDGDGDYHCSKCGSWMWTNLDIYEEGAKSGTPHYITDYKTCSKCNGAGYYYTYPTCYGTMTAHHKCSVCSAQLD